MFFEELRLELLEIALVDDVVEENAKSNSAIFVVEFAFFVDASVSLEPAFSFIVLLTRIRKEVFFLACYVHSHLGNLIKEELLVLTSMATHWNDLKV